MANNLTIKNYREFNYEKMHINKVTERQILILEIQL